MGSIRIGIVVAEWNSEVTGALLTTALAHLQTAGVREIPVLRVPGALELVYGARCMMEDRHPDAVIVLGCVIKGETPHFEYVSMGVTKGITDLNVSFDTPVIFGVLTVETTAQAIARIDVKTGKGVQAAEAALRMAQIRQAADYQS
jgi:6,7-dimethyl-8-ribityllumazine synthase